MSGAALLVAGGAAAKDDVDDGKASQSVSLLRVKVQGSVQMQKAKIEEAMTIASDKFQAMEKVINDEFEGDMAANLATAKTDTEKVYDTLVRAAKTATEKLQKCRRWSSPLEKQFLLRSSMLASLMQMQSSRLSSRLSIHLSIGPLEV